MTQAATAQAVQEVVHVDHDDEGNQTTVKILKPKASPRCGSPGACPGHTRFYGSMRWWRSCPSCVRYCFPALQRPSPNAPSPLDTPNRRFAKDDTNGNGGGLLATVRGSGAALQARGGSGLVKGGSAVDGLQLAKLRETQEMLMIKSQEQALALAQAAQQISDLQAALAEARLASIRGQQGAVMAELAVSELSSTQDELAETQLALRAKDDELSSTYSMLQEAAKQRAALRLELASKDAALRKANAQLAKLASGAMQVQSLVPDAEKKLADVAADLVDMAVAGSSASGVSGPPMPAAASRAAADALQSLAALTSELVKDADKDWEQQPVLESGYYEEEEVAEE